MLFTQTGRGGRGSAVFVTGAIFGAASAFFGPASDGLVPQTVSAANLQPANALLGISRNALNIFGQLPLVRSSRWPEPAGSSQSIRRVFVASAFFVVQLRVRAQVRPEHSRFFNQLRDGFHEVTITRVGARADHRLRESRTFCFASFIVLGPKIFLDHFNGAGDWGLVSACVRSAGSSRGLASVRLRPCPCRSAPGSSPEC